MTDGGARYNHKTFSLVGFGTVCDSLLALRRAYAAGTQQTLLDAVAQNFEGCEPLRRSLQTGPDRFGHSAQADEFAAQLADALAQVSRGISSALGMEWGTSLFTYYCFHGFGARTQATPDGRKAGQPLSRQSNMADIPALTTAALSMAAITGAPFNDVHMFDIPLPHSVADADTTLPALADFIRTCVALKLPVLQTNVADPATMREERQNPGTHPGLVVRVCGFSAPFAGLSPEMQDEIIARAE
jgi:formate C-acetyltransferase